MLTGGGQVSISHPYDKSYVRITLDWGYYRSGNHGYGGYKLEIEMTKAEYFLTAGRGRPFVARIRVNDREWEKKIEDAIYLAITSGKCRWFHNYDPEWDLSI